jgi:hypothetical protein
MPTQACLARILAGSTGVYGNGISFGEQTGSYMNLIGSNDIGIAGGAYIGAISGDQNDYLYAIVSQPNTSMVINNGPVINSSYDTFYMSPNDNMVIYGSHETYYGNNDNVTFVGNWHVCIWSYDTVN